MNKITPMMQQYLEIKEKYPDAVLFYRMGDFYEMFMDDAIAASGILEIALTSRDRQSEVQIPMCGVPYHAAEGYIARLVSAGKKVAICDQVEDPRKAKGLVRREVTRVITPGLVLDGQNLSAKQPNYLAAVAQSRSGHKFGLAFLDVSTAEFKMVELDSEEALRDELIRVAPRELLLSDGEDYPWTEPLKKQFGLTVTSASADDFDHSRAEDILLKHFRVHSLDGFGVAGMHYGIEAAGAVLAYTKANLLASCDHVRKLLPYSRADYMIVDDDSVRNLEIFNSLSTQGRKGSLLDTLDETRTAMGGRKFQQWLRYPLLDLAAIQSRQEAVAELLEKSDLRSEIFDLLSQMNDIERLNGRNSTGTSTPRDLVALKKSLQLLPQLKESLSRLTSPKLNQLFENWDTLADVALILENTLVDPQPLTLSLGGIIHSGVSEPLDHYVRLSRDAKGWMADYESRERQRSGISSLKVRYNKVFGYYIEVSNANLSSVPEDYFRKQTLVNAERFITEDLKVFETQVLEAEEKRLELEQQIFGELRLTVSRESERIRSMADLAGDLDCLVSLAEVAGRHDYCRPRVDTNDVIQIRDGRHPVVELFLEKGTFVPNDLDLDQHQQQVLIITGPNMAGKSTILRQAALIVLMAQIGSFIPASEARIGIVDRIFTRVGASDDLARGRSTFMVEMQETANILHNATPRSLIILDEIGRGTSTYDGLSIAWAVAEHLHEFQGEGVKTLFATHYHELTELSGTRPRVKNFNVAIREWNQEILFFHKLVRGGTNRSYGIQVAKLAGLPEEVTQRATEILKQLESGQGPFADRPVVPGRRGRGGKEKETGLQMSLFHRSPEWLRDQILALDLDNMTPIAAMQTLHALKEQMKAGTPDKGRNADGTSPARGKK